jgi:hypothetical protein
MTTGLHRIERTARRVGAAGLVLAAMACSGGGGTGGVAPAPTAPAVTTTTTIAPGVASVDGDGRQLVVIPASVGVPAIVHARYAGSGSFVATGVDGHGADTKVLAVSLGGYDGTFPVGFDDAAVAVRVQAAGPWHLDMADAASAPRLGTGVSGTGDAVLSYVGPPRRVLLEHPEATRFVLRIYAQDDITVLADREGPYREEVDLPAGPAFLSVSTAGTWSIRPAAR